MLGTESPLLDCPLGLPSPFMLAMRKSGYYASVNRLTATSESLRNWGDK